jgi:phage gp36-like protein
MTLTRYVFLTPIIPEIMFIEIEELKTHLYGESIQAISGGDDTILTAAIDAAVGEARGYLAGYDRNAIFSATGGNRSPLLLVFIKDIAVWHYMTLCNAGTELSLRQDRYCRAIDWLRAVQKGAVSPDLPREEAADAGAGAGTASLIKFGSNPKREQHY